MKKLIAIMLAAIMVFAFAACANDTTDPTQPDAALSDGNATDGNATDGNATNGDAVAADVEYVKNVKVGTGGTSGTYYAFTNAVGQILNTENYSFEILSTGGSQANIEMIEDGDIKMAIVQNDVMNYAYNGTNGFNEAITSFSAVACVYPEVCQLVATKASGITSVADLAGKNVAVGDVGSGVYYNATQILAAAGLDIDADINKTAASFGDSAAQLKDGSIDAAFITAGTPTTAITELATSTEIVVVDLGADVIAKLQDEYSFYAAYEMTSADYDFITEPVNTVAIMATYVVSNDMPEEQVYEITKTLWETIAGDTTIHAKTAEMDTAIAASAIGTVPLHAGAARYYKEAGIIE
ncbi:MAG: TAXI family TRAP transporter solute-binding subunit [Clostridia bacterium]|nr:TAXI family TRAP transporter solute-binding subunit [Clostridia bacterium]MBR2413280.1 TAXI family TRAP transporter solute-binding subunit [Clostridia bacterium]